MSESKERAEWRFDTIAVHGGYSPEPTTRAVAVPLYQTVAYAFDNAQHGADLFDLKVPGNIYSRIMNPTHSVLEQLQLPQAVERGGGPRFEIEQEAGRFLERENGNDRFAGHGPGSRVRVGGADG